jgi:tight adherence protein B
MDIINILLVMMLAAAALGFAFTRLKIKSPSSVVRHGGNEDTDKIFYNTYGMKLQERGLAILWAAVVLMGIGFIFYRSFLLAACLTPFSLFYPAIKTRKIIQRRKQELKLQFKDALQSVAASLHSGKSLESAIERAVLDLRIQYEEEDYIMKEFRSIIRRLEANETIEASFREFAVRSDLEEIQSFAEVLEVCKRTGGNLILAIKSSTEVISDKIEVLNEIESILAQKKLEQKILTVLPVGIVLMLSFQAEEFMRPVFTQGIGRMVMTISILMFAVAYFIAAKITDIEV